MHDNFLIAFNQDNAKMNTHVVNIRKNVLKGNIYVESIA
jgi:hypothetical protein